MTDPDELQLSKMAKKMLATPHKNRSKSRVSNVRASIYSRASNEADRAAVSAKRRIEIYGLPREPVAIFDVETLDDGSVIYHMPFLLNPNGIVDIIAS